MTRVTHRLIALFVLSLITLGCTHGAALQTAGPPAPAISTPTPNVFALMDAAAHPTDADYGQWLADLETRIQDLFTRTGKWTDLAISTYPLVPDQIMEEGLHLRSAWVALALEIDRTSAPDNRQEAHAELQRTVDLASASATALYENMKLGDAVQASQAAAQLRVIEEALNQFFLETRVQRPPAYVAEKPKIPIPEIPMPVPIGERTMSQPAPTVMPAADPGLVASQAITATVATANLGLQAGPGDVYLRLDAVSQGTELILEGRNSAGTWVRGHALGQGLEGWFSVASLTSESDLTALPIVGLGTSDSQPSPDPMTTAAGRDGATEMPALLDRTYCLGQACMSLKAIGLLGLALGLVLLFTLRTVEVSDTEPPSLVSFDLDPKHIDTSRSDQTITVTARIIDRRSGVGESNGHGTIYANLAQFASPSGNQKVYVVFTGSNRQAGDGLDGTYSSTMTLPQNSEAGTWKLTYMELRDNAGNRKAVRPEEMSFLGFPQEFHVSNEPMS